MEDVYLVVKSIDLLTKAEAKEVPRHIRVTNDQWWLQSPGLGRVFAAYVDESGSISISGNFVYDDVIRVRPAILIEDLDKLNLPPYTMLEVFDKEWIYIGNNKALARYPLFLSIFDKKSNEYATSYVKKNYMIG